MMWARGVWAEVWLTSVTKLMPAQAEVARAAEFGAGAAIGPPLAGYIYDTTGSYTIPLYPGQL